LTSGLPACGGRSCLQAGTEPGPPMRAQMRTSNMPGAAQACTGTRHSGPRPALRSVLLLLHATWPQGAGALGLRVASGPPDQSKVHFCFKEGVGRAHQPAKCGVLMMAFGGSYGDIARRVAARTATLSVAKGWCPLDPELDHIPVTIFADLARDRFNHCNPAALAGARGRKALGRSGGTMRRPSSNRPTA